MNSNSGDFLFMVGVLFLAVAGLCAIGIAVGIPAAGWLGQRFANVLSGLSDEKFDIPPPRMGVPASMTARGDLEGALEYYEKLLIDYPHEQAIYCRMLEIALGPLRREAFAESVLARGLAELPQERERQALQRLHDDLMTGRFSPMPHLRKIEDC